MGDMTDNYSKQHDLLQDSSKPENEIAIYKAN